MVKWRCLSLNKKEMKYYTLDQAVKKAYIEGTSFDRDRNLSFTRGMYNLARGLIGLKPKIYWFERDYVPKEYVTKKEGYYRD